MEDLEAFKESRLKMDPTSRKLSEQQWKQAYDAHLRARGRVSAEASAPGSSRKRRRSHSGSKSGRGQHQPSTVSELATLRHTVRQQSAYSDLRLAVDILAWSGVVLVVLAVVASLFYFTGVAVAIVAILQGAVKVMGIILLKLLVHVIVDIPDIALYRTLNNDSGGDDPLLDTEH